MELYGFKSFSDKTVVSFNGGILCIIGPNGCGKSNLVDAFRWVFGEQSVRALRSDKMEEVIFQGSSGKKQKGVAEVSLTFAKQTASDGNLYCVEAHNEDEITLTRRLYRSGESEYLINKRQCRLKDIRDILLSAGVDPKSYAMFDNIRVSEIINARPHERRFILEEIAGVAKYKVKKTEADAKLESSKQNLIRINDIIYEIKRQMGSLERQVRKAERYKKLSDELKLVELRIAKMKHTELTSKITSLVTETKTLSLDESALRAEYSSIENNIEAKKLDITLKQGEASSFREELSGIEANLSNAEKNTAVLKTLLESKNAEISRLKQQIETSRDRKNELLCKFSEIDKNKQMLSTMNENLSAEIGAKRLLLEDIESILDEKDMVIESKRRELFSIAELISTKKTESSKISAMLENLKYRESSSNRDINSIKTNISAAEESVRSLESSLNKMCGELKGLSEDKEKNQIDIAQMQRHIADKNTAIHKAKENIASLLSRLESLKELIAENPFEGFPLNENKHFFTHSLADFIKVCNGYENAIEAAFSEKINSVVIDKKEDLFAAIKIIKEKNLDKTCLLYTGLKSSLAANADLVLCKTMDDNICTTEASGNNMNPQKASFLVAFEANGDKEKPSEEMLLSVKKTASEILFNIYVVNDLNTAIETLYTVGLNNRTIVTLDGDVITSEGIIIVGKGREILKRKHEINELHKTIAAESKKIEYLESELDELQSGYLNKQEALKNIEYSIAELQKMIALKEQNLKNLRDDIQRKQRKLSFLETDIEALLKEKESLNKTLLSISDEIKGLEARKEDTSDKLFLIQNSLVSTKKEHEITSEHLNDLRLSFASCREKFNAIDKERNSISEMLAEMAGKDDAARKEISEAMKKLQDSSKELEDLRIKIRLSLEDIEGIRGKLSAKEKEIDTLIREVSEKESELKRLRSDADELSKRLSDSKARLMEYRLRAENVEEMIMQKYSVKIDSYILELTAYNTEHDEKTIVQLSEKIQELGVVNLGTIEDFEELKDRYKFMKAQKEDLETSISELQDAITKINNTTKKKLREAYAAMRIKFSEIFLELFGGGKADIVLTEEDDILHSGIEIIAQPPGKKLQNLNLLSGGEKALTTLALMFAGFLVRPMPLCVLDEVDAPLDESNTTRFAQMLRRFSEHTQFLIITHNRATMEIGDFLYGITMEDPGISKLISLKFADS